MNEKQFRYTLKIDNKETVLKQAPIGWDEHALRWARSEKYHGLIRSFSLPIKFVTDGAKMIRRKLYSGSIESAISLKIEMLNYKTWDYDLLHEADLDLSTVVDNGITIECNFADSGIASLIKANENVRYEIDLDNDPDAVVIRVPGVDRTGRADMSVFASHSTSNYKILATFEVAKDISSSYIEVRDVNQVNNGNTPFNFQTSTDWFLRANSNIAIRIKLRMKVVFGGELQDISRSSTLFKINSSERVFPISESYVDSNDYIDMDFNISLQSGEKLFLNSYINVPTFVLISTYEVSSRESIFEISYALTTTGSFVKAIRPLRLFSKLVEAMTGIQNPDVYSPILKDWESLTITSGDGIRDYRGSKIKTSFSDFYKSIDAVLHVGFGIINGVPTIDKRETFYKKDLLIFDVGDVKDFELTPAIQFIFNSIKAGYPNKDYERPNGREEYNSGQMYSTPVTRLSKEIDITSIYRADQYGIEGLRLDRIDKNLEKEDEKSDNDTFFIHIEDTPHSGAYHPIGEEAYQRIEGISTRSSSYNMGITPKNNLLRHIPSLYSFLQGMQGSIYFASADKNSEFLTVNNAGLVVGEGLDVPIGDMTDPLFYPYMVEFECKINPDTRTLMSENPEGYVIFRHKGNRFMGFILETSIDVSKNSSQRYKLLLYPLNNILDLI